jgi:hypothetical protein
MKKHILSIIFMFNTLITFGQSVSIQPNSLQLPRFATNPACTVADNGKMIYNTTSNQTYYCDGTTWVSNDWKSIGNKTLLSNPFAKIGIGENNPIHKIQMNVSANNEGTHGIQIYNQGNGKGIFVISEYSYGVHASTGGGGAYGILGDNYGGGIGVVGRSSGSSGLFSGGILGTTDNFGFGIKGSTSKGGIAVIGEVGEFEGTGSAAFFENKNTTNNADVMLINNAGNGNLAVFKKSNNNVARIDQTGKGFFNGGTQASGADLAEAFAVEGNKTDYETGDVLVISERSDRTVMKSNGAYSDKVVGVYATKPGVLLTEESIDNELTKLIPMGVVGVILTKVSTEGGEIKRGDLLVTSSVAGVAMKADREKLKIGQCIGKALENYSADDIGKIKVLVNVK